MTRRDRLLSRLKIELHSLASVAARGDWEAAARVQRTITETVSALRDMDAPTTTPNGEVVTGPWQGWRP